MTSKIPILFDVLSQKGRGAAKKLSEATGISPGNISDWKSGKAAPTIDNLKAVADHLDCSVDYLLGRTNNPQSHKGVSSVSVGDVSGNSGNIGVGNTVAAPQQIDEHQKLLLDLYIKLSPIEQVQLISDLHNRTK